jgi:hypothetical protein
MYGETRMILFGHRFIKNEKLYHIDAISSIKKTPPNSLLYMNFLEENLDIITHCMQNELRFTLHVHNVTEVIYAENFGAAYISVEKNLAKDAQKIANEYLFDAKILVLSSDEEEIESYAYQGIDGILFSKALIKINS